MSWGAQNRPKDAKTKTGVMANPAIQKIDNKIDFNFPSIVFGKGSSKPPQNFMKKNDQKKCRLFLDILYRVFGRFSTREVRKHHTQIS
jgi:hypothetical protein